MVVAVVSGVWLLLLLVVMMIVLLLDIRLLL
jgi:hypothetical protein